ncbi:hypothetical protein SCAR479_11933 [Seiridium cardinale]|uniref:2EXR domain-containing protein n=1 Tax=Seiridium cardinale TaxID=138064 RepID=A0ABR2XCG0_9PEZI
MPPEAFPQFRFLYLELRLMVWKWTWPGPRAIQVISEGHNDLYSAPKRPLCPSLRLSSSACRIRDWPQWQFGEDEPVEECANPITLFICRESRYHVLTKYVRMQHATIVHNAFYFNPAADRLWLIADTSGPTLDVLGSLEGLAVHYGEQLNHITRVVVSHHDWWGLRQHYLDAFFDELKGLRLLDVILNYEPSITPVWRPRMLGKWQQWDSARLIGKNWEIRYHADHETLFY